jgi:HD-GYP domain-containing protein (c-di-GMP phosphodiesterase class II)
VADVFDALTSDRVYRPAFTSEQAGGPLLAHRAVA